MAEFRILHIYSDLLDLYGDYANLTMVQSCLHQMGHSCTIDTAQLGEPISLSGANLVYIGHGKARNLAACAEHFSSFGAAVREAIEHEQLFFVTGNARLLFGKTFETPDGSVREGIGLFDYHGRETGKVFTSDVLSRPAFDSSMECYGFINRTSHIIGENHFPLFEVLRGKGDNENTSATEGTLYKNFFGTWQMGPFLVRNPNFLRELLRRMTGEAYREIDLTLEEEALKRTLAEFHKK